jgi:hypothetical protein
MYGYGNILLQYIHYNYNTFDIICYIHIQHKNININNYAVIKKRTTKKKKKKKKKNFKPPFLKH